jgi:hypothetical protein
MQSPTVDSMANDHRVLAQNALDNRNLKLLRSHFLSSFLPRTISKSGCILLFSNVRFCAENQTKIKKNYFNDGILIRFEISETIVWLMPNFGNPKISRHRKIDRFLTTKNTSV